MTEAEYERTRVIPERISAADRGKELVRELVETVRARLVIEAPKEASDFDRDEWVRWQHVYFYFTKYLFANTVDRETLRGSAIYQLAEDGKGNLTCCANAFHVDTGEVDLYGVPMMTLKRCYNNFKEVIDGEKQKAKKRKAVRAEKET